jgi:hypothetical protein
MTAITTRMPAGFPGSISRSDSLTVEQEIIDSSNPPAKYGVPIKIVGGKLQGLEASDAGSVTAGWMVKPYPTQSTDNNLGSAAVPPTTGIGDRMRRGFMTVTLAKGTAAKGGQVYVVTTAGGTVVLNDIVTSASPAGGGTGVAVTGSFFTGPADAGGVVEIEHNI